MEKFSLVHLSLLQLEIVFKTSVSIHLYDKFHFHSPCILLQVLFKVFEEYIKIGVCNIIAIDIAAAIASFFVVAFGGLFIGLIFGYVGSFITKFTVHNRIVEPTFVFILCYLSYLTAEIFHLSGIIA